MGIRQKKNGKVVRWQTKSTGMNPRAKRTKPFGLGFSPQDFALLARWLQSRAFETPFSQFSLS